MFMRAVLLEGTTDIKRFGAFIDDDECSLVNCYGRKNAVEAIKLLYEDGFSGALGVVDADFGRLDDSLEEHEGLVYSEAHDFDLDWARPNVVERYFAQVADPEKRKLHGSASDVIDKILKGLKPLSVARFLNHRGTIRFRLTDIDIAPCFVDFVLDVGGYVDLIFAARTVTAHEKQSLKDQIVRAATQPYDLRQLTNGHDFHCAVGACLRADLGSRIRPQTWATEVEMHLRLTFSDDDFRETLIYNQIIVWTRDNKPYGILHSRFL
jgi:hypothetical protein